MSLVIERFLMCDGNCGNNFGVDIRHETNTTAKLRRNARGHGWLFKAGEDFCPDCRKAGKHK